MIRNFIKIGKILMKMTLLAAFSCLLFQAKTNAVAPSTTIPGFRLEKYKKTGEGVFEAGNVVEIGKAKISVSTPETFKYSLDLAVEYPESDEIIYLDDSITLEGTMAFYGNVTFEVRNFNDI